MKQSSHRPIYLTIQLGLVKFLDAIQLKLAEANNQGGSPFQVHDGKRLVSEPKSVATKFNKFFAAIGSKVAGRLRPVSKDAWKKYETVKEANKQSDIKSTLDFQRVEQNTVQSILHSLKVNKEAGLDSIPARLLKDAEAELLPSITYLVNKSISDGIVPDLWKVARVTPLYKSDDKLQVENYRPISVLPVLSKVVECPSTSARFSVSTPVWL